MRNTLNMVKRLTRSVALLGAVGAVLAGPALAQSIDEIANYNGADRLEKLAAAAKNEGSLTLYTATPVEDVTAMTDAFTAKYGIPVTVWRGSSEDVLRRAVTEINAGRYEADVIETNGPELEALHREKVLQPIESPVTPDIFPGAVPAHKEWVGSRLNIITVAYNTDLIAENDVPKTWNDLLDPKWKGKVGLEAEAYDWLATVDASFPSEKEGIDFFTKLAETNGISLRKGHTLLTNLTASGEVPLALTTYLYKVDQMHKDGAPINWLQLGPSVARINGLGVAKTAQHPNAAILFQDFTLTDGQKILAERGFTPTNTKIAPLPKDLDIKVVDGSAMLDKLAEWRETFETAVK
ncbi:extracellular solute-binding protein [Rhizobium sp. BK251]|uniref:ABC transporter substrate-binding protein n=1 Tax=Rhizobium sp. BK251 TaxID=2512125 RepID=UPI0010ED010F|nr:extracellular solute-binding protein [Rhizobium sp. BK251]TCL69471.1 iron(III) transport system substrate-binding protein [Rhizobium sp. BK251]